MRRQKKTDKLTTKQQIRAIVNVAVTAFRLAPAAVLVQLLGSIVTAVLPLITTYFAAATTSQLVLAYNGNPQAGTKAMEYVVITAILGIAMTVWRSIESYISQLMQYRVEAAMTDRMYEHFLRLDFWRYDDKETADRYDKARRFAQFFPYIFIRLSGIVTQFFTMVSGVVALIIVSWWLGLIALVSIIPGIFVQLRISRLQARHWEQNIAARRTIGRIEWAVMEPQFMAELRLYNVVRHLLDIRITLRDKDEKERISYERTNIVWRLAADVFEAIAEIIALIWVTLQIIHRSQPIGQFVYVQQVVSRALGGAAGLVSDIASIDEDLANLYDYQIFMDLPEQKGGLLQLEDAPSKVELKHVSFRYPSAATEVLKDVSLAISRGQHVAIVGENGAGKSTLIKILTGLYHPTGGRIEVDGKDLKDIDSASWHKNLGVLTQNFITYTFATVRQNVFYGDTSAPLSEDRVVRALERAEAKTFVDKLPQGLENHVDQWMEDDKGNKGQDLSGGQWQRLALARNFYRNAPIIILDEPTSAIDALAESRIFNHIFGLKNKMIITISHRLTTVLKADIVYMLKDGVLVESGTAKELIVKKGEFYTMFESQIK